MEILFKDLSGKPEPGVKRFRHLRGRSGVGGGGFHLCPVLSIMKLFSLEARKGNVLSGVLERSALF